jgi:hypothetical protein
MKEINKNCQGSLVFMVLIMMAACVIMVHSMLRSSSYLVLLAKERKKS